LGRGDPLPLRALPRLFVQGIEDPAPERIPIPDDEFDKLRKVLRLGSGDEVGVLPGDGRLLRCRLDGRSAVVEQTHLPQTESETAVSLALGLPKPDKLEESVRMATELGVVEILVFPSARSVVRWDAEKVRGKVERLRKIAREACEVSFRTRLPSIRAVLGLSEALDAPSVAVLSEGEGLKTTLAEWLTHAGPGPRLVIGPEGGWAPDEVAMIGERAVTLGPRVLRVDTAVAAACSLALCVNQREE
jgi:16S rRNA (uracil1498-N3)-methyltransferase